MPNGIPSEADRPAAYPKGQSAADIDRFMAAISGNESGGNYNAKNKSGAYGKFQIMPANWPSWSREALGPGNHPQTPANQEAVARFKMLQYYAKYHDWDAVAIAWFAGPGRADAYMRGDKSVLGLSDGGTTVGAYVNKVHVAMGKPGDVIGGPAGGTGQAIGPGGRIDTTQALPAGASPAQVETYIRTKYPDAAGFLDVPEIRSLLIRAAQENYDDAQLEAELHQTQWWKTHGADARAYFATKNVDPATHEELVQKKIAELAPTIAKSGLKMDLRVYAENALKYGWTPQQTNADIATRLRMQSSATGLAEGSDPEAFADELAKMARNEYFVPMNRQDVERWAIDIGEGRRTEAQYRDMLTNLAESRFPGLKQMGVTPGEYLAPIRNVIAETLELQPGDVDLLSPRFSDVLQDPETGKPLTIGQAQRWARGQKEYTYTKNAMNEASNLVETLNNRFGMTA